MPKFISHADSGSAATIVWSSVTLTALRLSLEAANRLILLHLYGYNTVTHDHLSIVRVKPELVVSNGDILKGWGFFHYLIGASLWLASTLFILTLLFKYVTPQCWREQSKNGGGSPPGGVIGIAGTLIMFFCIPGILEFIPAVSLGLAAAILGLFWLRVSAQESV